MVPPGKRRFRHSTPLKMEQDNLDDRRSTIDDRRSTIDDGRSSAIIRRMKRLRRRACAAGMLCVILLLSAPALAQFAAPNDVGVTLAQIHLIVTDVDAH